MKKRRIIFCFAFFCSLCIFSFAVCGEGDIALPDEFGKVIDELPSEVSDKVPQNMYSGDIEGVADAVTKMSAPEYIAALVNEIVGAKLKGKLSLFASLVGTIIFTAIFNSLKTGIMENTLSRAVSFCSVAVIFALITSNLVSELEAIKLLFERIEALMVGIIPSIAVIYAMGGNVTTAAASSGTLYLILSFCETVCAGTVVPITAILTSLSLCGALSPDVRLSPLSSALKKSYTSFLTLVMSVLLFVLSTQTLLSSSRDSISARAAKLMASSAIPIVGGSVGETLRTVGATVSYIKNVTGLGGMFFILILVLPPLISLLLTRLALIFSSALAEMLGCSDEHKVLEDIGGIYGTLLAVVSAVGVTFILALGVFIRCAVAVG